MTNLTKEKSSVQADSSPIDYVTQYADEVLSGAIIAGPHVRDACRRHKRDLKEAPDRGFFFDVTRANRAIEFFQEVLYLNGGEFEDEPFDPLLWQKFIIGSLFGWVNEDGLRRFRVAYVETSKGSGKSPLAAGIGMYGLVADGEARAEIYAAATKKDQAMVLFRDAVAMVDQSPELAWRINKSGTAENTWNLAYRATGSFFRPISADDSQSGPRPHVALLDEIHEHKSANVVEMMRAGTKGRRQALIFMITNSGFDKNTVCGEYHDYGIMVASGQLQDDSFFSFVCALDENEDPFKDESCWPKTNPSLGVTIQHQYLREQVTQARGIPSKESLVRRLNFSQWVRSESPWISSDVWFGCQGEFILDKMTGRRCVGGLDLSSTTDLTSLSLFFEPIGDDPFWRWWPFFWLPDFELDKKGHRDGVDYLSWLKAGHLETTPGKAINKLFILHRIAEISSRFNLVSIAYDRWRVEDLKILMQSEGVHWEMESFGQGFKDMSPAVEQLETMMIEQTVIHNGNPCLTWNAANAVTMSDPAGLRKPAKNKSTGRIDGIVSGIMAAGISQKITTFQQGGCEFW